MQYTKEQEGCNDDSDMVGPCRLLSRGCCHLRPTTCQHACPGCRNIEGKHGEEADAYLHVLRIEDKLASLTIQAFVDIKGRLNICLGDWLPLLNHLEVVILMSQQNLTIILLSLQDAVRP